MDLYPGEFSPTQGLWGSPLHRRQSTIDTCRMEWVFFIFLSSGEPFCPLSASRGAQIGRNSLNTRSEGDFFSDTREIEIMEYIGNLEGFQEMDTEPEPVNYRFPDGPTHGVQMSTLKSINPVSRRRSN